MAGVHAERNRVSADRSWATELVHLVSRSFFRVSRLKTQFGRMPRTATEIDAMANSFLPQSNPHLRFGIVESQDVSCSIFSFFASFSEIYGDAKHVLVLDAPSRARMWKRSRHRNPFRVTTTHWKDDSWTQLLALHTPGAVCCHYPHQCIEHQSIHRRDEPTHRKKTTVNAGCVLRKQSRSAAILPQVAKPYISNVALVPSWASRKPCPNSLSH